MNLEDCKNDRCNNKEGYMLFGYCELCFTSESTRIRMDEYSYYYGIFVVEDILLTDSVFSGIRIA